MDWFIAHSSAASLSLDLARERFFVEVKDRNGNRRFCFAPISIYGCGEGKEATVANGDHDVKIRQMGWGRLPRPDACFVLPNFFSFQSEIIIFNRSLPFLLSSSSH
jgi:hypothetical protein